MLANRSMAQVLRALFGHQHYIAFFNMMRIYENVWDAFKRYLFGLGDYPSVVSVKTPTGVIDLKLYTHHDMLTVNEIFCRKDYRAPQALGVVVDIGSNIGISAAYFLTRNKTSRCYLYEPDPANILKLRAQLSGQFTGRFELFEYAVADFAGTVAFGVEETGRYGGIGVKTERSIPVECRHINDVIAEVLKRESVVDVLKIDTEGVEIATVKAIDVSLLSRVGRIYIEASPNETLWPGLFDQVQYTSVCQFTNVKSLG